MRLPPLSESCQVALTLSVIVRLHIAFMQSENTLEQKDFLLVAADYLDRTLPHPDLEPVLFKGRANLVPVLVHHRDRIAAVPLVFWHRPRCPSTVLGQPHHGAILAVDAVLRGDSAFRPHELLLLTEQWLEPAWQAYPELRVDCLPLKQVLAETGA